MTVHRFLHIEQDVNNALQIQVFTFETDAVMYLKNRVLVAINRLLGDELNVPPVYVDASESLGMKSSNVIFSSHS